MQRSIARAQSAVTVFRGGAVLAPGSEHPVLADLWIEGDRIRGVGNDPPVDAAVIDCTRHVIVPGLIDAHAHLFLDGGVEPRATFVSSDSEQRQDLAARNALTALSAGVTTINDLGSPLAAMVALGERFAGSDAHAPRILFSGPPVTRRGGHCWFFGGEVSTPREAEVLVHSVAEAGATTLKLMLSGGGLTPGTRPEATELPPTLARAAVTAARAERLRVSAHCHSVDSMQLAVALGVDTIEHGSFLALDGRAEFDAGIATEIARQGIAIGSTAIAALRSAQTIRQRGPASPDDRYALARLEARLPMVRSYVDVGVSLVPGSDSGVPATPADTLIDELIAYVNLGLDPLAVLSWATADNAARLGLAATGSLDVGWVADFAVLPRNPLEGFGSYRNAEIVVHSGRPYFPQKAARVDGC